MAVKKEQRRSVKISVSGKNKYLDKLTSDSRFRLLAVSALGGGWNFIYAVYHLVLAACFKSYWFLTMGIYYLTVCAMRATALRLTGRNPGSRAERNAFWINGILTLVLAIVFSGVICLSIVEKRNKIYPMVVALSMAIYTFYCVITAVINLVQLKKDKSTQKILLRNCSMVYALGSLFGLERMMLGTFGNAADHFTLVMEAASGTGIFIIIILIGLKLLRLTRKYR